MKPENMTPRWRELEKEFNELVNRERDVMVKNEFDKIYTTEGSSGMNAFTSEDMTGYFITVPPINLNFGCGWNPSGSSIRSSAILRGTRRRLLKNAACHRFDAVGKIRRIF